MKSKQILSPVERHWWMPVACCVGLAQVATMPDLRAEEPAGETIEPEAAATDAEAAEPETFTEWLGGNLEFTGWADVSGGAVIVDGNQNAFQRRYGIHADGFGGVNELHWEKYVGENGLLTIDARAIVGNDDYDARIGFTDETKGYLRAGYTRFRTWDDGTGGFYPLGDLWYPLPDADLQVDHERIWAEAGLTLANWPTIDLRYSRETRRGMKSSTIWGTTQVAPGISGIRGIAASFRDLDETRETFEANIGRTFGRTDAGIGLRFEKTAIDNSLNTRADVATPNELSMTQRDTSDSDLFNVHASSVSRFNDQWTLSAAYGYTALDTGFAGSRIYGLDYDPVYDPSLARYSGYTDLAGSANLNQHVAGVNLAYRPASTWVIIPSIRFESTGLDSDSSFLQTPVSATSAKAASSNKDFLDLSQRLEARYTGIKNWVLYARGDWAQGNGDLAERFTTLSTGNPDLDRKTDLTELRQKYTAGANWYPLRKVNLSAQYYYKAHDHDYDHVRDSTPNNGADRYPAYLTGQDSATHDVNVRVSFIPAGSLVSVSRYDYQTSTIETEGAGSPALHSADIQTHIFSQSLTWNPLARLYLNATFSYVTDLTETPANELTTVDGLAPRAENDYWQAAFGTGYLIDDRTDVALEYTYSEADNYEGPGTAGLPYGAGYQEHAVIFTLTRRVHENLRVLARYGYFDNNDETYGGNQDYTAHLVWGGVQYRF